MISGLWNGVTGLNTFERALNTQSNNVTNSNTIAHKKDDVSFEDLMYQSRYGNGVKIQNVEKNFEQGNLKVTNNTLDVAIDGQGFFIVNDVKTGETLYTRAGNFKMGTDGTLQTAYGDKIYGSPTTFSNIISTDGTQTYNNNYTEFIATEPINGAGFSRTINAKATDYTLTAVDTGVSGQGFKSSSALLNDIREISAEYNVQLDLYSANPIDGTASSSQVTQVSFSDFSTELTSGFVEIYINNDSIKQPFETDAQTTMNLFADKISNVAGMSATVDSTGLLTVSSLIPGRDNRITGAAINSNGYGINEIVSPVSGTGYAAVNSVRDALSDAIVAAGGEFLEVTNTINDAGPTLAGIGELQLKLDDLNISENVFGALSIEDGLIFAKDQDNKFLIGKLETVTFQNPESLKPQGETLYTLGKDTGNPYNADNLNTLTGGSIELSNTNFSESLVDLMVYQRAFEASSKSVTTSDEFLRTAIEMKK